MINKHYLIYRNVGESDRSDLERLENTVVNIDEFKKKYPRLGVSNLLNFVESWNNDAFNISNNWLSYITNENVDTDSILYICVDKKSEYPELLSLMEGRTFSNMAQFYNIYPSELDLYHIQDFVDACNDEVVNEDMSISFIFINEG